MKIRSGWVSGRSVRRQVYAIASGIMGGVRALRGGVVPEGVEKGAAAEEAVPLDGFPAAIHPT